MRKRPRLFYSDSQRTSCPKLTDGMGESLKAYFGETQAKKVLGYWKRRTFLAFCVPIKLRLYDVTSQEHSSLLSFLSVEKQTTFSAGYEMKREIGFLFSTSHRRASTTTAEPGKQCCQVGCSKIRKTHKNSPYMEFLCKN